MRIALLLVLVLIACKPAVDAPKRASCATATAKQCEDYEGNAAFLASRKKDCTIGTWAATACPTTNVLGSCREEHATWTRTRHYYPGAAVELPRTKAECGAFGTWLEPAAP